jgi:hypothetical protein
MEENEDIPNISTVLGCIFLIPPVIGVVIFILTLFGQSYYFNSFSIGEFWSGGGEGYSSTIPIYLGLMAIAGAYLIKDSKRQ